MTPSTDPSVRKTGYKFYYFHNPAISFAEAVQDFSECRKYLVVAGFAAIPGFVPWDQEHRRKVPTPTPMYPGLVSNVLAAIIVPKLERGVRSNKMRRCMETRGYVRYAIPEATWDVLNAGDEREQILLQAKLSSGPAPRDEPVTE